MCASRQMPEEAELNFIHYLKRRDASPNTIKSCLASCRLYYSLFGELNTTNLMLYKDYLVQHYTAATVNNRIYGINRYLDCIGMALDNKGRIPMAAGLLRTTLDFPRTAIGTAVTPSVSLWCRRSRFLFWTA